MRSAAWALARGAAVRAVGVDLMPPSQLEEKTWLRLDIVAGFAVMVKKEDRTDKGDKEGSGSHFARSLARPTDGGLLGPAPTSLLGQRYLRWRAYAGRELIPLSLRMNA